MFYTIYKITNKINNKIYIGKHQTKDIDDGYIGSGKMLRRAIAKYGIENFSKDILFVFETEEDMNAKESELVTEEFCLRKDTYNLCRGGKGGFSYINRTIDHKERNLKISKKRNYTDPNYLNRLSESLTGKARNITTDTKRQRKELLKQHGLLTKLPTSIEKKKNTFRQICHQQGELNSQFGTKWVTQDGKSIKILKDDIERYLDLGYSLGRK